MAFDTAAFRALFPAFSDTTKFPDALLNAQYGVAQLYIDPNVFPCGPSSDALTYVLQLMVAHLLQLGVIIAHGNYSGVPGIVINSSVGDVSVGLAMPPYGTDQWRYWMNTTPYGAQLVAFLETLSAGGFLIGALPETASFRKVGGFW